MTNTKPYTQKLLRTLPTMNPDQFRNQTIELLGSIVKQRIYVTRKGLTNKPLTMAQGKVIAMYSEYHTTWTIPGIARFIIMHRVTIREMVPLRQQNQLNKFNNLLNYAENYLLQLANITQPYTEK